jgi:hypothetical protein
MPRLRLHALVAALAILLAILASATPASAQDDGVAPGELEGLQRALSRTQGLDYPAIFAAMATPGSNVEPPQGVIFFWGTILEFDSTEHATAAMDQLDEAAGVDDGITVVDAPVTEIDLALGDRSVAYSEVQNVNGQHSESILILVQKDNYVYFVVLTAVDDDARARVAGFVTHMIETPTGEGDGTYSVDGASSGGLWDKFPPRDDPALAGLIATDAIVYPEPTPAA